VDQALSLEPPKDKDKKHNCISCDGMGTVGLDEANIYTNASLGLTINVPAYVCSKCDSVVYEPDVYAKVLEAEEASQGRAYVKVKIVNGKINKHSVH
jgi:hypothetical protein